MDNMKRISLIITCVLLLLAVGCSNEPDTFIGNQEKPTTWTVPDDYDMTTSMTAIVKVDLSLTYPEQMKSVSDTVQLLSENDLLAAFVDSTCLGVAQFVEGLFFLYITTPAGEASLLTNHQSVTLRYYSAYFKNTFEALDAFLFANDTQQGTVSQPFKPEFLMVKK